MGKYHLNHWHSLLKSYLFLACQLSFSLEALEYNEGRGKDEAGPLDSSCTIKYREVKFLGKISHLNKLIRSGQSLDM